MLIAKTLLNAQNPITLRSAIVQEDAKSTYLVLLPCVSSIPECQIPRKSLSIPLYRRKTSRFEEMLYVAGMGPTHKGISEPPKVLANARAREKLRRWFRQIAYRSFLASHRRGIKVMTFKKPPGLKLLWAESGHSVAVFLNGEPWAFIHEEKNRGYSKGVLKPEMGNVWDQELFEKTFLNF